MDDREWIERFSQALGSEAPDAGTVEELLELAAIAAHASERTAAPIACYLAGRDGRSLAELKDLADEVAGRD